FYQAIALVTDRLRVILPSFLNLTRLVSFGLKGAAPPLPHLELCSIPPPVHRPYRNLALGRVLQQSLTMSVFVLSHFHHDGFPGRSNRHELLLRHCRF